MKILKIIGVLIVLIIITWIIFSSRYWGDGTQKSPFLWEQKYDNFCWKQYLGVKIDDTVLFKLPGKTTKCI